MIPEVLTLPNNRIKPFCFFNFKKLATTFLALATALKYVFRSQVTLGKKKLISCPVGLIYIFTALNKNQIICL